MKTPQATFILGATGGIGSALARFLVSQGGKVFLAGRSEEKLATLAAELKQPYGVCSGGFESVKQVVEAAVNSLGECDAATCLTGSLLLKPAHMTTEQEYDATMDANVRPAFALVSAFGNRLPAGGSIVLVSSAAARIGLVNHEAIAAAKGAISSLTLSAAATYARRNVRVNCVAPGLVDTPLTERITKSEVSRTASVNMHALRRLGTALEVAEAISWLLSPSANWITGQILGVDGGLGSLRGR